MHLRIKYIYGWPVILFWSILSQLVVAYLNHLKRSINTT